MTTVPFDPETDAPGVNAEGYSSQFWEPRRALTLDAARRHTVVVLYIRRALMVMAGALLIVLLAYFIKAPSTIIPTDNPDEAVKMVNPVYSGRTTDDLPYRITADSAVRLLRSPDNMKLENPVLNFLRNEGAGQSVVLALGGEYNAQSEILELQQDVNLKTDDGYACKTGHARILIKDKRIEGDQAIACTGSFGQAGGNAYEINDGYSEFVFKNGMTARLIPEQSSDFLAAPDTAPQDGKPVTKPKAPAPSKLSFGGDAPIDVKADLAVYKGPKTVLTGNVFLRQETSDISADQMNMFREELDQTNNGIEAQIVKYGNINRIVAVGNFKYVTPDSSVTGKKGVYERDKNIITVTGNVKYVQTNGSSARGEILTYDLATNKVTFGGRCKGVKCGNNGGVNITVKSKKNKD
jgi:lipopolysaccharide transport protein LptA